MSTRKYNFVLKNIDPSTILARFNLTIEEDAELDAVTTLLRPIPIGLNASSVKLQNEFNESRNHYRSMIPKEEDKQSVILRCYWCHHTFDTLPIRCPLRYKSPRITHTYVSGINNDQYSISECVTSRTLCGLGLNDVEINTRTYEFETDGIFCSFNCTLAFIKENNKNPLYDRSENYLHYIYGNTKTLIAAPHWRLLDTYGGPLSIEQFRSSFDHLEVKPKGFVSFPLTFIFEENIRL